jgi:hypothetical protein
MPSPFPGMDPYIETPELWLEFHNDLAAEIRAALNRTLDPRYRARLTSYLIYESVEVARPRSIQPDVAVWRTQASQGGTATAVATIASAPVESAIPMEVPLRFYTVEVVTTAEQLLVTVIEILSPANKRAGHETHAEYTRKRRDVLRSQAHMMEIDLLRGGTRPRLEKPVPQAPYYVVLSRAERRPTVGVWPIQLADTLPPLPVPLLEPDPDAPLDLQAAVASVYERSAFERAINYRDQPPPPPLSPAESNWVNTLLRDYRD